MPFEEALKTKTMASGLFGKRFFYLQLLKWFIMHILQNLRMSDEFV